MSQRINNSYICIYGLRVTKFFVLPFFRYFLHFFLKVRMHYPPGQPTNLQIHFVLKHLQRYHCYQLSNLKEIFDILRFLSNGLC